ncbi:hypothetical protein ACLOJK_032930 [Asimina triloba]
MIQKRGVENNWLRDFGVVHLEKEFGPDRSQILGRMDELAALVEACAGNGGGGLIIDLGDVKWLVEQPVGLGVLGGGSIPQLQKASSETGLAAMGIWDPRGSPSTMTVCMGSRRNSFLPIGVEDHSLNATAADVTHL